ncbi:adhesion G-protein coupled receptor F1-like [Ciona intestinalis]
MEDILTSAATTYSSTTTTEGETPSPDVEKLNSTSVKIYNILQQMAKEFQSEELVSVENITRSLEELESAAAEFAFSITNESASAVFGDVEIAVTVSNSSSKRCFTNSVSHEDCLLGFSKVAIPNILIENGQLGKNSTSILVATQFRLPNVVLEKLEPKYEEKGTELFQTQKFVDHTGSQLSASVYDKATRKKLRSSLTYLMKTKGFTPSHEIGNRRISSITYSCEYYDVIRQQFFTTGCRLMTSDDEDVTCFCNHTTIFAVLLSVTTFQPPLAVKVISYITESLSVVCLIFTLVVLVQVRKQLRSERTVVQINLTASLLLLHLLNIIHELAYLHTVSCTALTFALHFFLLSTGAWMFLEAFTLAMMTSHKALYFDSVSRKKLFIFRVLLGWGAPFVVAMVTFAIGMSTGNYVKKTESQIRGFDANEFDRCWLTNRGGMLLGAAVIPLALICVVNFAVAVKVLLFIHEKSKESLKFLPMPGKVNPTDPAKLTRIDMTHVKAALKGFVFLFPVLGLPWILGFLTGVDSYEASVAFMYLNVILNGLQGVFLMLIYCVLGSDVRKAWLRKISCVLRTEVGSSTETSGGVVVTAQTSLPRT